MSVIRHATACPHTPIETDLCFFFCKWVMQEGYSCMSDTSLCSYKCPPLQLHVSLLATIGLVFLSEDGGRGMAVACPILGVGRYGAKLHVPC